MLSRAEMEVEYAFLADSAQTSSDGKLYALGAGIGRIYAERFPVVHPYMSLVLKLQLHPAECEREHELEVELWDPDGNPIGGKLAGRFSAERQPRGRPSYVQLVLNIQNASFKEPGDYQFHIMVDKQIMKTLALTLESVRESHEQGQAQPSKEL